MDFETTIISPDIDRVYHELNKIKRTIRIRLLVKPVEKIDCYVLTTVSISGEVVGYSLVATSLNGFCTPYETSDIYSKWHSDLLVIEINRGRRGRGCGTALFHRTFETVKKMCLDQTKGMQIHTIGEAYKFYLRLGAWVLTHEDASLMFLPYTRIDTLEEFCGFFTPDYFEKNNSSKLHELYRLNQHYKHPEEFDDSETE